MNGIQTGQGAVPILTGAERRKRFFRQAGKQKALIFLSIPIMGYILFFNYLPLWGWIMAFQNYKPAKGFFTSEWVGLEQFARLFGDDRFYLVLRNTLAMSLLNLVSGTVACIFLAIVLSEVKTVVFKRSVQTISYLPFFVSWVVAANIVITFLSPDGGVFNDLLMALGVLEKPVMFLGKEQYFWVIVALSNVWKNTGYGAIVYLSAITSIDPMLYESAQIDGATRLQRIWHITLPGILPTVVVLLIINIGGILNNGFEQQMLLGNPLVLNASEVLDLYVLRYGISLQRYSFSVAAGMFKSVISVILILSANGLAKKLRMTRLF
jgi:putative aldouronate transport system permease protein